MTQSRWITNNWELVFQTTLGLEIIVDNHLSEADAKRLLTETKTIDDGYLIAREMTSTGDSKHLKSSCVSSHELTSGAFPG